MSAIRLPGPDGRIVLVPIDDGAVGRITHTRYAVRGEIVVARTPPPRVKLPAVAPYKKRRTEGMCGYALPSGACARMAGHGNDHRSAMYLEWYALRQRTGRVVR